LIGNLTADAKENITSITWTPSNKIDSIVKTDSRITYAYDAAGNRVRARVYNASNVLQKTTWYVRDASGTVLSIYEQIESGTIKLKEVPLYGSDRVGMIKPNLAWSSTAKDTIDAVFHRNAKERSYELKDHLGNVRVVVSDEVTLATGGEYLPNVLSRTDYYPFGMAMETRTEQQSGYRYGFNGKENDNDVKGAGNQQDYGARTYDPRVARWMSMDALAQIYPSIAPYAFALNPPVMAKDPDGNVVIFINGQHTGNGGTAAYWGGYDYDAMRRIDDYSARYVDGAMGGWISTIDDGKGPVNTSWKARINAGEAQGKSDAASIISKLKKGETIKIVTHSMGTAFARGYVVGIQEWAMANPELVSGDLVFEYELDVNAMQASHLPASPLVKETHTKMGGLDGGTWPSILEPLKTLLMFSGKSVPTVGLVPNARNTTDASDKFKGHPIEKMSRTDIPSLGNGGDSRTIEQGSNNEKSEIRATIQSAKP